MESATQPDERAIKKESSLSQCLEKGWDLFTIKVSQLDKRGKGIQGELLSNLSFIEKLKGWKDKLNIAAEKRAKQDDRLGVTGARIALMTENARYYQVLVELGEGKDAPQGYINMMEGFRATSPWNKTGRNPITLDDVTQEDLDEALNYIKGGLGTS